MASNGQWLIRSVVAGYGASAGHSAWRATKNNYPAIVLFGVAFALTAALLYFVYKFAKALFEPSDNKTARVCGFGTGAVVSIMYLSWVLYWSAFLVSSFIHPAKLPGYDWVPQQVVSAVYENTVHSMVRSALLVRKLVKPDADDVDIPFGSIKPNEENPDLMATLNLVARLYFLAIILGAAAGVRKRRQPG